MCKKRTFILLYLILSNIGSIFSQEDQEPYLNGYPYSDYLYFDSIHKAGGNNLSELNRSYTVFIALKIDTNAAVIDLEFIEIPVAKIPDEVKSHMLQLVMSTNQKWIPQIKNSKKVVSDEIIYMVSLCKKSLSLEQNIKDSERSIEYFFGPEIRHNEKLQKFNHAVHKRYILLSY